MRLNHAVAVGMADGPAVGLALVDALALIRRCGRIRTCRARAATCWRSSGRLGEARREFARAAGLTGNARERDVLLVARPSA